MAVYSATLIPSLTVSAYNSSKATTAKLCSLSLPLCSLNNSYKTLKPSVSSSRVFAAPEALDADERLDPSLEIVDGPDSETHERQVESSKRPGSPLLIVGTGADKTAPKQKIRIKLRSYWVPLIEDSCKQIMDAARTTNAKTMGPVPLPAKTRKYCVLKSPHVHKDAKLHVETRTHQRVIDILYPTAQTIDSLMKLNLPAGVDVEVKL